jgi:hypothetical protein
MAKPNRSCEEVATLGCREVPFEALHTEKQTAQEMHPAVGDANSSTYVCLTDSRPELSAPDGSRCRLKKQLRARR